MAKNDFGMHIVSDDAEEVRIIPTVDAELRDFGEIGVAEAVDPDDVEAERHAAYEAHDFGVATAAQPDTQGADPIDAALGEDGQGDLGPGDGSQDDANGARPDVDQAPPPNEPDGQFDSQEMPTTDGEMIEGRAD